MPLRISSLYQKVRICRSIQEHQTQESTRKNKSSICKNWLRHGIRRMQEKNSIVGRLDNLNQLNILKYVSSVKKSLKLSLKRLYSVGVIARQKTGGAHIQAITPTGIKKPVFNLHVPLVNNFVLEGGVVVHNCYDHLQYACASRPYITTRRDRLEAAIAEAKRMVRKNS